MKEPKCIKCGIGQIEYWLVKITYGTNGDMHYHYDYLCKDCGYRGLFITDFGMRNPE